MTCLSPPHSITVGPFACFICSGMKIVRSGAPGPLQPFLGWPLVPCLKAGCWCRAPEDGGGPERHSREAERPFVSWVCQQVDHTELHAHIGLRSAKMPTVFATGEQSLRMCLCSWTRVFCVYDKVRRVFDFLRQDWAACPAAGHQHE